MQFVKSGAQLVRAMQKVRQGCQALLALSRWWRRERRQPNRYLRIVFGTRYLRFVIHVSFAFVGIVKFIVLFVPVAVFLVILVVPFLGLLCFLRFVSFARRLLCSVFALPHLLKLPHHIRLLGYPKKSVRAKAFAELLRQGEKAVPLFLRALSAPKSMKYMIGWDASYARALSAFGLGRLKTKEAVEPLMGLLREQHLSLAEQCAAIWALGELGNPKAIPVLLPSLGDLGSTQRWEGFTLLQGLPTYEKERMLKRRWRGRIYDWAADALTKLGAQNLVDDFQRVLNERDEEALQRLKANFRLEVMTALMKVLDTYRHTPRFRETEPCVSNAAWALGKLRATEAISVLRREARRSPFPLVREVCGEVVKELEAMARLPMSQT